MTIVMTNEITMTPRLVQSVAMVTLFSSSA